MQNRHIDRDQYFREQAYTTSKYVIPFLSDYCQPGEKTEVLEIGCGEGGNLLPFAKAGCRRVVGVDLSQEKIANGEMFHFHYNKGKQPQLIAKDIFEIEPDLLGTFDLIIARDTLEHIHGHARFMRFIRRLLKPTGVLFLAFPPWHNPFGGHQQICRHRLLSKLPYIHLLPRRWYYLLLKRCREPEHLISELMEIRETQITIEAFERIKSTTGYSTLKRHHYFINPNYEIKFGLKPRKALPLIGSLPRFRNYSITVCYYLLSKEKIKKSTDQPVLESRQPIRA